MRKILMRYVILIACMKFGMFHLICRLFGLCLKLFNFITTLTGFTVRSCPLLRTITPVSVIHEPWFWHGIKPQVVRTEKPKKSKQEPSNLICVFHRNCSLICLLILAKNKRMLQLIIGLIKGTNCLKKGMWHRPCLIQL